MSRILLVDDDIAEISAVKRVLSRAGHATVLATNVNDAHTAIEFQRPELVIVGATCEGGRGVELTHELAESDATADLPVVVLGTVPDAAPTASLLPRPVDPAQLADLVKAAVGAGVARPSPAPRAPPAARRPAAPAPRPAAKAPAAGGGKSPADALLARASQLRQGAPAAAPRGPPTARLPAPAPRPAPPAQPNPEPEAPSVDEIGDDLEAMLKRAEEAERAHAAEKKARARQADRAVVEAAQRAEAEEFAISQARAARQAQERERQARERAREEEQRRAEEEQRRAEEEKKRAAAAKKAEEERRRASSARRKAEEEQRKAEEERARAQEERLRAEEARHLAEEEQRKAEEERRRATEAEGKAREEERRRAEAARRAVEEKKRAEAARRRAEEETRRAAEAEEKARAQEEQRLLAEEDARAQQEQRRLAEEDARAQQEQRHLAEEKARAQEEQRRRAEEKARAHEERRRAAEEAASSEKETRQSLEAEVQRLREQLGQQKRDAEAKLRSALDRAAAEGQAAEEARRLAAAQAQEEAETQVRSAIESARSEMEVVRREREVERRRRADAEAELARLAEATERLDAERAALAVLDAEPSAEELAARRRIQALRPAAEGATDLGAARVEREPHRTPSPEGGEERPPSPPAHAELRIGTVDAVPLPRLLALAAQTRMAGRLDFQGDAARSLYFDGGRVVGATSNAPQERLEEVALRLGMLTRDQHRAAASAVASLSTRRAGVLLLERGYIKPHELTPLVRGRTEEVVFGLFADEGARFRWAPERVPSDERVALEREPLALAVEGVRRRWLQGRLDAVLGGPGTLLSPVQGAPAPGDLGLSPDERRLLQLADGLRTLDEIVAASPLDPLTTRQILAALALTGALAIRVLQAGRPASAAATAIDLARVRDKLDQVRRADYFTILGVARGCTPHEVRAAADRLLAEFEPRRFPGHADDDLTARLDEIRDVLQDAREVLADDALREAYVAGL